MRIAIVSNNFLPYIGGIERQNQLLSEALVKRGHEVTVLTRRYDPALPKHEIRNGVRIQRLWPSGGGVLAKWLMNVGVCRCIAWARPAYDVVLVTQWSAHILGAALGSVPRQTSLVIKTSQNDEFSGAISDPSLRRLPFGIRHGIAVGLGSARAWALRRVDFVIALSKKLAREAEAFGFQKNSIVLCPQAVDVDRFRPVTESEKVRLRASLGIDLHAEVVTYVSRLVQGKGHLTLIDAWVGIARERPQALLLLVGGGPGVNSPLDAEVSVRKAIEAAGLDGRVRLTGPVKDVERYLQAGDVFVFPSEAEGFGNTLAEAMACGMPVICSNISCGSIDYIVEGVHGYKFAVGNGRELRVKLSQLLADVPCQQAMGRAGRVLAAHQLNLECVIDENEKVLMAAASKRTVR